MLSDSENDAILHQKNIKSNKTDSMSYENSSELLSGYGDLQHISSKFHENGVWTPFRSCAESVALRPFDGLFKPVVSPKQFMVHGE